MSNYTPSIGKGYSRMMCVCTSGVEHTYTIYTLGGEVVDAELTFNGVLCKDTAHHLINEGERFYPNIKTIHDKIRNLVNEQVVSDAKV